MSRDPIDPLKLSSCITKALEIRDTLNVKIKDIFIVTRCWSGRHVGEGGYEDTVSQIKPTPAIRDFSHDIRLRSAGAVKQGDLILEQISKDRFPKEDDINGKSSQKNIEIFYRIGDELYIVISHVEHFYWWNVQVRRLSSQRQGGRLQNG